LQRQVAEAILAHQGGKNQGDVPGFLKRWAERVLAPPAIDYKEELKALIGGLLRPGTRRLDHKRPNVRRAGAYGGGDSPYIPAYGDRQPTVIVAGDTSGSVDDELLGAYLGQLEHVFQAAEVFWVSADTQIYEETLRRITSAEEVKGLLKGGGGTSMANALRQVSQLIPERWELTETQFVILFTDGWTDWPSDEEMAGFPVPVLAIVFDKDEDKEFPSPHRYIKVRR
jgi:predicted metal-dependent peptidase